MAAAGFRPEAELTPFLSMRSKKIAKSLGKCTPIEKLLRNYRKSMSTERMAGSDSPWAGPRVPTALSLRGSGRQVLRGPASKEEEREEILPSPGCPVADEGRPTAISISGCVPPTVAARGGKVVALILARDRVSIPSRYYTDWGVASQN